MDQDLIQKISELLSTTFTSTSSQLISMAESSLNSLSQDHSKYFEALLCIISSSMSKHIKNSAGLHLKKFVKDCMDNEVLIEGQIQNWGEVIFQQIIQPDLDFALRANLGYSLLPLLSIETAENKTSLIENLLPHIISGLKASVASIFGMLRLIKTIYSGYTFNPLLYQYFLKLLPAIAEAAYTSLTFNLPESWDILEECSGCVYSIIEHFQITARHVLIDIQNIPELCIFLKDLIQVDLDDANLEVRSLVHIGTDEVHSKYNSIKEYAIKAANLLVVCLKHQQKRSQDSVWTESPMINMLAEQMDYMAFSLGTIISFKDYEEVMQLEFVANLVNEILVLLASLIENPRFFEYFKANYVDILTKICMPLIKLSANDLESFEENPEEFVAYSCDLCEKQHTESCKSSAVSLLISICKHIDGSLSSIWYLCYELLEFQMAGLTLTSPHLDILPNSDTLQRTECILFTFSVLSPLVSIRFDLIQHLEALFRTQIQLFYNSGPLIKNRLCLIIKYYSQLLFYQEENFFFELVKFVIFCCNHNENNEAAVNIQGSDTLATILQDDEMLIRIFNFLPSIFMHLVQIIRFQDNKEFFEVLFEMVDTNLTIVLPYLQQLVPNLVEKIRVIQTGEKKDKGKIIIDKCWNIILSLLASSRLSEDDALSLEESILIFVDAMREPEDIEFDDKVLQFEVILTKKCGRVSKAGWELFCSLEKYQAKHKNSISGMFQFLNTVLNIGKEQFSQNPAFLTSAIARCEMCLASLFGSQADVCYAEAALIYQQMLIGYKGLLDDRLVSAVLMASQKLHSERRPFLNTKILGLVFASLFHNVQITENSIVSIYGSIDAFIEVFLKYISSYTMSYDIKLAVLGLCDLLQYKLIPSILKALITLLSHKSTKSEPNSELTVKFNVKKGFNQFEIEEVDLNIRVSNMLNDLETFDEYSHFRDLIKSISLQIPSAFTALIQSLDQHKVFQLTEIIQSQRVKITSGLTQNTEVRRLVKVKLNAYL